MFELLTRADSNPKAAKSMRHGAMTFALHLAPGDLSGREVCPMRTDGCTAACLNTAGRAGMVGSRDAIQAARLRRTLWYFDDRHGFMLTLAQDIHHAVNYARFKGMQAVFRLNATSDIPWHRVMVNDQSIMDLFPEAQFYDYTKVSKRLTRETLPANYHLTFSLAEDNRDEAVRVLEAGGTVAAVFRSKEMVRELLYRGQYMGFPVIDGDETDQRYLDPHGVVVALYAKGPAKTDRSGFVKDL